MSRRRRPPLLLLLLAASLATAPAARAQLGDGPPFRDVSGALEVRWGDSPRDAAGRFAWLDPTHEPAAWLPADAAADARPASHDDVMWVRFTVPAEDWRYPVVYLPQVFFSCEAYVDGTLALRRGEFAPVHATRYESMASHFIPLPERAAGSVVALRVYSPVRELIGLDTRTRPVLVGDPAAIEQHLFLAHVDSLVLGALFCVAGVISLAIFLRRLRLRLWILAAFAWLSVNIGLFYVLTDSLVRLLDLPGWLTYYVGLSAFTAFPVGIYAFLEQMLGRHRVLRALSLFHLAFMVVALALDLAGLVLLPVSGRVYSLAFVASIVVALVVTVPAMLRGSRLVRVFGVGFLVFSLTGLHDLLAVLGVLPATTWLSHWGMLVLVLHLAYILEQSYSDTVARLRVTADALASKTAQLEEYSETLEQRVADRTRDLADKNEHLVQAMRSLEDAQAKMAVQSRMASLGNLVAGVAHEMNTPLGAVMGAADVERRALAIVREELLAHGDVDGLRGSERFRRAVDSLDRSIALIGGAGERLRTILGSLKSFARLDEAAFRPTDLHDALENTLTLMQHELRGRIAVVRRYGRLPLVGCHADRINQLFMNLLLNAAQAIDGAGTLKITTDHRDGEVTVAVADDGAGIAADDLPHIFDPGFTTKGVGVGTGLGLSICYRIVQDHGGRIEVASEPGAGTTFTVHLPVDGGRG